uniref:CCHC-type domain-containing protein n=1 Tax=Cannabis sativa TaxID=3483 RepID=A0A803QQG8_CANSA
MGELGEPLQVDNVTKNKDRLQYPRISILVTLSQDFPDKIAFIDEFNHEVELDVKFEWIPLVCYNCSGMGHSSTDCKKKKEKKEPGKQVWVPKKTVIEKQKQIDAEGFQKVNKGKKILLRKDSEGTTFKNIVEILGICVIENFELSVHSAKDFKLPRDWQNMFNYRQRQARLMEDELRYYRQPAPAASAEHVLPRALDPVVGSLRFILPY